MRSFAARKSEIVAAKLVSTGVALSQISGSTIEKVIVSSLYLWIQKYMSLPYFIYSTVNTEIQSINKIKIIYIKVIILWPLLSAVPIRPRCIKPRFCTFYGAKYCSIFEFRSSFVFYLLLIFFYYNIFFKIFFGSGQTPGAMSLYNKKYFSFILFVYIYFIKWCLLINP